jgi:hypothetical protein
MELEQNLVVKAKKKRGSTKSRTKEDAVVLVAQMTRGEIASSYSILLNE